MSDLQHSENSSELKSSELAIEFRNLKKSFKNVHVLEGISFGVKRGTMLALLGPNGAGKTTTVRIASTLLKQDDGEVLVDGYNTLTDATAVRERIGLTGQYAAVDELLSGRENLIMMGRLYHLGTAASTQKAEELLARFDLVEAADRAVKTYSGGMRRRLDLAASLVANPPIIFLDEPTTGLDPRSRITMWKIIEELKKEGATILLTTQYLEEADKLADQIAVIDHGKVIAFGTANELKALVGDEYIEITVAHESNFDMAVKACDGSVVSASPETRTISIATDGSVREVKRVLDALYEAGIELDGMSVHKPTLDDVFLKFTGRAAETAVTSE